MQVDHILFSGRRGAQLQREKSGRKDPLVGVYLRSGAKFWLLNGDNPGVSIRMKPTPAA